MQPILGIDRAQVFYDGTVTEPRLLHPEGVAVGADGEIWCGGELGQIYRIDPDGSSITEVATTSGFTLGIALDGRGHVYTCDLKHQAVFRLEIASGQVSRFADGGGKLRAPNFPVVDLRRNCLYVSDCHTDPPEPGIWRFDLETGAGEMWYDQPLDFANGMALAPDGNTLYVVETFSSRVSRVPIGNDGSAGDASVVVAGIERLPDGMAVDADGNLYISCYEPSRLYRATVDGRLELLIDDPTAHILCHPTNCAFRGSDLFTANLGRWHITKITTEANGLALPVS
jgi:sugar lactone lactonase YvrE